MTSKVRFRVALLNAVIFVAFSTVTRAPTATEVLGTAAQISPFAVERRKYVYELAPNVSSTEPLNAVRSSSSSAAAGAWDVASRLGSSGRKAVAGAACALNSAKAAPAATAIPSTAVMPRLAFRAGERGFMVGYLLPTDRPLRPLANGDKNKHVPPTCAGLWQSPAPWFSAKKCSVFQPASAEDSCFPPSLLAAVAPAVRRAQPLPTHPRPKRRVHRLSLTTR